MRVTVLTAAPVSMKQLGNRTDVQVLFAPSLRYSGKKQYVLPESFQLETNGAIIESIDPPGKTLEIIDFDEFKSRFPRHATGTHFCYLTGVGTAEERCDDRECSGICTMHPNPKYCSCD
jgi:hypothetical protein